MICVAPFCVVPRPQDCLHLRNTDKQPLAPLHHTPVWKNVERRDPIRQGAINKDSLAGTVQVTAMQFLSPVGDKLSHSLTMPWPAAAAIRDSRGAPRRVGDRGLPEWMAEARKYRGFDAVSAGCVPGVMMLPRIRSCQTKRCRAAPLPPHSNPHHLRPSQNHLKVKTR